MTKRLGGYLISGFFLAIAVSSGISALAQDEAAQEGVAEEIVVRPKIEYKSSQLRDPFVSALIKEKKVQDLQKQKPEELTKPKINLESFKVQGVIWGAKITQAIINNKVLVVGDSLDGAKVVSIDKKGVVLDFSGEIIILSAPGRDAAPAQKANNK